MRTLRSLSLIFLALILIACDGGRSHKMEALLDKADSLNRSFSSMTGLDSLLREATDFYDHHGTANEQMRAHYLLGCAYRDMGEAPAALQSYQNAIDRADTLSNSCDFHRLMAIYGQMADLFDAQNLPNDELDIEKKYGQIALKLNDTLLYVRNLELTAKSYYLLNDTAKVIQVLEEAKELYTRYGYASEAVSLNGLLVSFCVNRGELDEAQYLINEYESKSGLFDSNGEIEKGREIYYEFKGSYYISRHQIDSAESYMRKLLKYEQFKGEAYRGLMRIYRYKGNIDSTVYYSTLFEKEIDIQKDSLRTENVHRISSLYNYQRHQRNATEKTIALAHTKAQRNSYAFILIIVVLLLLWSLWLFKNIRDKRKLELVKYQENIQLLAKTRTELALLLQHEQEYQYLIAAKRDEIAMLENKLNDRKSSETLLRVSDIYTHFHSLANIGRKPSEEEWKALLSLYNDIIPGFNRFLTVHKHELNLNEYYTCVLTRIHIKPKAIGSMLGISAPYISKIRREMSKKFFTKSSKPSDFDKQICEII